MKNMRTCVACRAKKEKKDLLRIVKNKNGEISFDKDKKADGRGAYVCNCEECKQRLLKSKALSRVFKSNVNADVYAKIGENLSDK